MTVLSNIWNFQESEFHKIFTPDEKLKFILKYAVLAPSSHNTQPWLFKIDSEKIYLYADWTRRLDVADPKGRELIISCGAALFNIRIASHHFGYKSQITTFPDSNNSDLLACIKLSHSIPESSDENFLFGAIKKRHTNRQEYQDWGVPESLIKWLQADAQQEGAWLDLVKGNTARHNVATLVAEAERLLMSDPNYRHELANWIHPSTSKSHDGIPGYAQGIDEHFDFATPLFALILRTFDLGNSIAKHSCKLIEKSPVIVILSTSNDTPTDWLAAGQALERVLLRGQALGLCSSFLNQSIQVSQLRNQLSQVLSKPGFPQIMLRLGFGKEIKPTPRRVVDEVLSEG